MSHRNLSLITILLVLVINMISSSSAPVSGDELLPGVEVDSTRYRQAVSAVEAAETRLAEAETTIESTTAFLEELNLAEQQLERSIPSIEARREVTAQERAAVAAEIQVLAQEFYALGDTSTVFVIAKLLNSEKSLETAERLELYEAIQTGRLNMARRLDKTLTDAEFAIASARDGLKQLRGRIRANSEARADATFVRDEITAQLPILREEQALSRRIANVRGADFQLVTLDAYRRAALNAPAGCNIDWTLLAGIGRIESRHGRFGGRTILPFGSVSEKIIGIALNGENSTLEILDTDGGVLDGDMEYDRAVGPMQFIPTTWTAFAVDGNGDGLTDPQNIYDSAAAAATYLCRSGDLTDTETLTQAIRRYNNSDAYVAAVLAHRSSYAALRLD